MDLQKVKESLEEIVNQDTGTWDKPVPFSVLHTRSLDIARDALSEFDNTPCLDTETYALKIWEMFEGDCRNGAILLLQQYAESYHAKKCAECKQEYSLGKKCTRLDNGNDCHARSGDVCMNMFQCPEVSKCK